MSAWEWEHRAHMLGQALAVESGKHAETLAALLAAREALRAQQRVAKLEHQSRSFAYGKACAERDDAFKRAGFAL